MTVFDSSALLALARQEPGALLVARHLGAGHVSAANACEFVQKVAQYGGDGRQAFEKLENIGLTLHAVERADAYEAAALYDCESRRARRWERASAAPPATAPAAQ